MKFQLALLLFFGIQNLAQGAVVKVVSGDRHNCALLSDGRVKCWGQNDGVLGLEDSPTRGNAGGTMGPTLPYVQLGPERVVNLVAAGGSTCAIFESGRVKCWGDNSGGVLGIASSASTVGGKIDDMGEHLPYLSLGTNLKVAEVVKGGLSACAIFTDGRMKCWGFNDGDGELGSGDNLPRGRQTSDMGDALPFTNLGVGVKVVHAAMGVYHTCVVTDAGRVKCFGFNNDGQLGLEDPKSRGADPTQMGDALPYVDLGTHAKVIQIAAGGSHTCVLFEDSKIKCWGENMAGELGIETDRTDRGREPHDMGTSLPFVNVGSTEKILQISSQRYGNCVLFVSGRVKCWGRNEGALGNGEASPRGNSSAQMGANLPYVNVGLRLKIRALSGGLQHECALLNFGGLVKCWGVNDLGQLGYEDTQTRGVTPDQMGDDLPFVDLGD